MKRVYVNEELCMGCGLCEVYCAVQHSKSKDLFKAFKRENPKPVSRIKLLQEKPVSFPVQCKSCRDPLCVSACLSGAMHVDEKTGSVIHDEERCIGCLTCVVVCPIGAVRINPNNSEVVIKCDLCRESETPVCVKFCPNEALTIEET
ncbi:MAG: 4Fe-4S dicluster domain-containing protein [Candidatus Bathyarchaeia archaeon]